MSKVKQADIDQLIVLVGGRENIATVSHCITRLRFVLNDPAKANPKAIEELKMVKGCFTNAGQFQVVIGTEVGDYYQALLATTGHSSADKEQAKKAARQNMKWHEQLISHFAEIFFTDVQVPVENRLGAEGEGWKVTVSALANERSSIGEVTQLQAKLDDLKNLVKNSRRQGKPAAEDPNIRRKVAKFEVKFL